MSACVLPLAPDFQDPAVTQNSPPAIVSAEPALGSEVTATTALTTFRVSIMDINLADNLVVRWIADYPPYNLNVTRLLGNDRLVPPSSDGRPLRADQTVAVDCLHSNLASGARHQIMVVVADRPFPPDPPQNDLTALTDPDGFAVAGSWTLLLECP